MMATFLLKPGDGDMAAIDEATRESSSVTLDGAEGKEPGDEAQRATMEAYQRVQLTRSRSGSGQEL